MTKLNKLTKEQETALPDYLDQCLEEGTSTAPADRPKAEAAVREAYVERGLPEPEIILWADSPLQATLMNAVLDSIQLGSQLRKQLRDQPGDQLWDQLNNQLSNQLRDQLWDRLSSQLWNQLWGQLRDQLNNQLGIQLNNQLWGQLWDQLSNQLINKLDKPIKYRPKMWGQHDLGWLGYYGFMTEVMGLKWTGDLKSHLTIARSCGWWAPYDKVAVLCERHSTLKRDQDHALHCESGPAVAYPDGWELYFWHGVSIPSEWIKSPDAIDPSLALTWGNAEQRTALAEILTWERVLAQLEPRIIDSHPDPKFGDLIEVDLPDAPGERFLRAQCGTGKTIALPVPREVQTALEAGAISYDVPVEVYEQLVVRT